MLVSAKSPVVELPLMFSAAVPLLVSVIVFGLEVVLVAWFANKRLAGVKLAVWAAPAAEKNRTKKDTRIDVDGRAIKFS